MSLKRIIILVFTVVVIIFGFVFYVQQKSIINLENQVQKLQIIGTDNKNKSTNINTNDNIGAGELKIDEIIPNPSIENNTNQSDPSEGDSIAVPPHQNSPSPQESFKELKNIMLKINDIAGEIKEIQTDFLIVEARIADVSKLDKINDKENNAFPSIIKKYKIISDKNTIFTTKKINELKAGDYVRVFSSKPIYNDDEFLATDISYLNEESVSMLIHKE